MKEIKVSNSEKQILVDDEDWARIVPYNWTDKNGTISRQFWNGHKNIVVPVANEVMYSYTLMYDHVDLNPYNNQKRNLRPCTHQQNSYNKGKQLGCSSKYKGVSFKKASGKWEVCIRKDSKYIYIGKFDDEKLAASAYNKKATLLFGEFAFLNKDENNNVL